MRVMNSEAQEKYRGRTRLKEVSEAKTSKNPIPLQWNSKGRPIRSKRSIFMSWIGVVARRHGNINVEKWPMVEKCIIDEMWKQISGAFIVPNCRHDWCMERAGVAWRVWKTKLVSKWLRKDGKIQKIIPYKYPQISQKEWDAFVRYRTSAKFQIISQKARENANKNKSRFRHSRLGYHDINERIDDVKKKMDLGEFTPEGRKDILHEAVKEVLGREGEHLGRILGVGSDLTITEYFGKAPRNKSGDHILKNKVALLKSHMVLMHQLVLQFLCGNKPSDDELANYMESMSHHMKSVGVDTQESATCPATSSTNKGTLAKENNVVVEHINIDGDVEKLTRASNDPAMASTHKETSCHVTNSTHKGTLAMGNNVVVEHINTDGDVEKVIIASNDQPIIGVDNLGSGWVECELLDPDNPIQIVAEGAAQVVQEVAMIHNTPMTGFFRVTIYKVLMLHFRLPKPTLDA